MYPVRCYWVRRGAAPAWRTSRLVWMGQTLRRKLGHGRRTRWARACDKRCQTARPLALQVLGLGLGLVLVLGLALMLQQSRRR